MFAPAGGLSWTTTQLFDPGGAIFPGLWPGVVTPELGGALLTSALSPLQPRVVDCRTWFVMTLTGIFVDPRMPPKFGPAQQNTAGPGTNL